MKKARWFAGLASLFLFGSDAGFALVVSELLHPDSVALMRECSGVELDVALRLGPRNHPRGRPRRRGTHVGPGGLPVPGGNQSLSDSIRRGLRRPTRFEALELSPGFASRERPGHGLRNSLDRRSMPGLYRSCVGSGYASRPRRSAPIGSSLAAWHRGHPWLPRMVDVVREVLLRCTTTSLLPAQRAGRSRCNARE